jgi:glycosyltransferase involved in cell wall biosynthesis
MKRQTNKKFIWMIIDDGSTDNTRQLVEEWMRQSCDFSIEYYYKENGGLHTAYNEAIAHINTELCVCIDSDDFMPDDAVEKILKCWDQKGSDRVAGIVGLDYEISGKVIGDPLPDQPTVNLIDLLIGKYDLRNGDRTNVVRTELYKKYAPMKIFPGEKNFNPHYMHLQISMEYDFLVLNENLRFVDYQPGGMSDSMYRQYRNSPRSFAETRKLYLSFPDAGLKFRMRQCIHYVSSSIIGRNRNFLRESPAKLLTILALPFGAMLAMWIYFKTKG